MLSQGIRETLSCSVWESDDSRPRLPKRSTPIEEQEPAILPESTWRWTPEHHRGRKETPEARARREARVGKFVAFVEAHPGLTVVEVARAMGTTVGQARGVLSRLCELGRVKSRKPPGRNALRVWTVAK